MNKYKLHIYNYDAIEDIDYSGFDLVITNPPYNSGKDIIFDKFCLKFLEAKYSSVIVPNKWTTMETLNDMKNIY